MSGDYRESWQPHPISQAAQGKAKDYAKSITDSLGGFGVFGVELFIKDDDVLFSEVSPRPHDTGMVTMISRDLSQFALHAGQFLGFPFLLSGNLVRLLRALFWLMANRRMFPLEIWTRHSCKPILN